ncbi:hypothetical protein BGZ95_000290 [Linnemannia exigua]|uniref:FAD-binding domain-containing protein n=1 Tax=Linnemannia exigua TaxID=604196 RepID=A0AAD4DJQ3_9FUNG|nr:hypothetical protein BGZ95_000290 [Linnemannia exigua]
MEINPAVTFKHDRTVMYAKRPKVLIVGAGLGGLTLAAILQKSDIPYEIFERATEVKPLGSAMSLGAPTAPFFKQLGIYDEFVAFAKYYDSIQFYNEKRQVEYKMHFASFADETYSQKLFGADGYIVGRPMLYDLMIRQIPKERIHMGKKILSTKQGGNGVLIRCSDGSEYEGDILVGADGAYSSVRQNLYADLKKDDKLPASDTLPLPFSTVCLVGQTRPLSSSEFPDIAKEDCQFINTLGGDRPFSWSTLTTAQNTVCWSVIMYLDAESSKDNDAFRNSEWGPEAAATMCEQVKDFAVSSGGDQKLTIGDLIKWTPKELISKVMLEEKVFKTWYGCRTVLIGDACHKFSPAGGAGAVNAMHDAVTLANYINALPHHPTADEITQAFTAYRDERIPWVQEAFDTSKIFKVMAAKTTVGKIVRFFAKYMPATVQQKSAVRMAINRPQVAFLPRAKDTGSVRPAPQPSLNAKGPVDSKISTTGTITGKDKQVEDEPAAATAAAAPAAVSV